MNTFHYLSIEKIHGLAQFLQKFLCYRRFLLIFTNSTTCLVDFWMFLSISLRLCNARFGSSVSPCLTLWGFCTLHPGVQSIPTTCSRPWRPIVASRPSGLEWIKSFPPMKLEKRGWNNLSCWCFSCKTSWIVQTPWFLTKLVHHHFSHHLISVGAIPNSTEVCIYKVDINYHLFFALAVLTFSATWSKHCGKVQKYTFKVQIFTFKAKKHTFKVQKYTGKVQKYSFKVQSILSKYKSMLSKYKATFGTLATESPKPGSFLIPRIPGTRFPEPVPSRP